MKLTFWGAAQQVTGSMYLLELDDDYRILIDCGSDLERSNGQTPPVEQPATTGFFPFEASSINVVLLTHAHIDHSGNLPNLYREGYEGQILCTEPTFALTDILLKDAASLNQRKINELNGSKKKKVLDKQVKLQKELFLDKQVRESMESVVALQFGRKFRITDSCSVTFLPAGHLLGAAHIVLDIFENGQKKSICFSGDIGRKNYPLLVDPAPVPPVDYLICESTYGNRLHVNTESPEDALADVIKRTCIDIPGRLIIPTFSVGRTQSLLYTLNRLYTERGFQPIKVFSDSPMGFESTKVYAKNVRQLSKEARDFFDENETLFDFENFEFLESTKASKAVSDYNEPCIIISSSGMVQGGRVEYHVAANIGNPYCTILLIGYCAEGTLGWRLLNGQPTLTIKGEEKPVLANIEKIDVFSGHGDRNDLMNFVQMQSPETLKNIFLVHGDASSMVSFKETLGEAGYANVEIPAKGQTYEL
ncbi:MBL fold metallo-hydrolase RNA specificity domain-containing protein [Fibrivirga algicola]|uniref:MBL fold metallo-hydrolase n=1 Tax=Fibrivirga algicola TaxID=2950420 RepID=A0ABX0QDH0_9BACT|nr:MBL fold metallo-hydrolase [Fibrivirga algicola]ARK09122.1 MBL fold hydrolase [Fibrella sp. ES10-3-2-2]NID08763.1 MBL fold metallo-hydrolase [Fibrivirga algicola]